MSVPPPGAAMHALVAELFPICRSITGNGVRETLRRLQAHVPLEVHEVPSGTSVLDWTVPREWNIRDAYVKNAKGERVVDFRASNLHVLNYSVPVKRTVTLAELKAHCYTLPAQPALVPYRTSYYAEAWGFCLPHEQFETLAEGDYDVCVDSTLEPGSLTYGEFFVPGETDDEVLISTHVCHPSLANDNLSGIAVATFLAAHLRGARRRHGYRFLFIPATIGSITWLARNEGRLPRIKHGLVLAGLGDSGTVHYKQSRRGTAAIDRAVASVLRTSGKPHELMDFSPYGYDERQYCSPGFDLAVGCLSRTPYGRYSAYHTSADNLAFVTAEALADSFATCLAAFDVLDRDDLGDGIGESAGEGVADGIRGSIDESAGGSPGSSPGNDVYVNTNPRGEPQLGRRGLYGAIGGKTDEAASEQALLWVLNLSDGRHSLRDIAERSRLDARDIRRAADVLAAHGLLSKR